MLYKKFFVGDLRYLLFIISHAHTETGYLPENFLPHFLDLVIWGHEHECLMDPIPNPETGFEVIQPGSSVVTSLCEGEAAEKFVGLLSITGIEYEVQKIRLATVRPFIMKEVVMSKDYGISAAAKNRGRVIEWLTGQIEELIDQANEQWRSANSDELGHLLTEEDPPLPLIRLRVEYSGGYEVENPRRFSNRFVGKVANVNDVVQFYQKKSANMTSKFSYQSFHFIFLSKRGTNIDDIGRVNDVGEEINVVDAVELEDIKVQTIVQEFLKQYTLEVLPSTGLDNAISQYVDKDDRHAIKAFVENTIENQVKRLLSLGDVDEDAIDHALAQLPAVAEEEANLGSKRSRVVAAEESGTRTGRRQIANTPAARSRQISDSESEDSSSPPRRSRAAAPAKKTTSTTRRAHATTTSTSASAAKLHSRSRKAPSRQTQPLFNEDTSDDQTPDSLQEAADDNEDMQDAESINEDDSEEEQGEPIDKRPPKQSSASNISRRRNMLPFTSSRTAPTPQPQSRQRASAASKSTRNMQAPSRARASNSRGQRALEASRNASETTSQSRARVAPIEIVSDDSDEDIFN